ncbi:hypothetical protein [Litoribacillus peritrichatus]|uniref:WxL domain-containing protein n=1 Tax=Litoribacillus peritrichatus TaxID=718191 RepID=A0ABP7N1S8_9GAMM
MLYELKKCSTKHLLSTLVAAPVLALAATSVQADVVELTPNELNSAYIKDSTIYIPKSTQKRIQKKIVNVKFTPGTGDPDQVDRETELDEQAELTTLAAMQADGAWDSTRMETSLANSTQVNIQPDPNQLIPRDLPGAPDGFVLRDNVNYTPDTLRELGFTIPGTNDPIPDLSYGGQFYTDNLSVSSDGTHGTIQIPVNDPNFQSGLPAGGINTDILSINQTLQNAINIRLKIPQN